MNHGSLFSGIGGFDLAAEWMGWDNQFHVERNDFCLKILRYYWPNVQSYEDIKTTDFTIWRGLIDVLSGGFPCQPYSIAGERRGKDDERHLWPEMLRCIREVAPSFVVGENVYGLVNWNRGMVFKEILVDLENEGFEVAPVVLPACSINAPHRRDRIWFVAYSRRNRERQQNRAGKRDEGQRSPIVQAERQGGKRSSILSDRVRCLSWKDRPREGWDGLEDRSPILRADDGISSRLDGITVPSWRTESNGAFGNAIVPQVAYQIFQTINFLSYE